MTRRADPLCTLRSLGYSSTTQHSAPAASTLCRVGLFTYRIIQRSFCLLLEASPPFRLNLAHITQLNMNFRIPSKFWRPGSTRQRSAFYPNRSCIPREPVAQGGGPPLLPQRPWCLNGVFSARIQPVGVEAEWGHSEHWARFVKGS